MSRLIGWEKWTELSENERLRKLSVYPLNENSVVYDVGGYLGIWAAEIVVRYNPNLVIFEPISEFYESLREKFVGNSKITVHPVGLSDHSSVTNINKCEDATSLYTDTGAKEEIRIVDVLEFNRELDLMSINCEGSEYPLLLRMLQIGMVEKCKSVQVQFHEFYPNAPALRQEIRSKLEQTHEEMYCFPYVWESWRRKA